MAPSLRDSAIADILFKMGRKGVKNGKGFTLMSVRDLSKGKDSKISKHPIAQDDPEVAMVIEKERHRKSVSEAAAKENVSSGLYVRASALLDLSRGQVEDEVQTRLLYCLLNEGFRLLGEGGVVSYRPGDIDIVYTYGYGWPVYKGGPMFYADFAMVYHHCWLAQCIVPDGNLVPTCPLLIAMVAHNVTVIQLQKDPSLVLKLKAARI